MTGYCSYWSFCTWQIIRWWLLRENREGYNSLFKVRIFCPHWSRATNKATPLKKKSVWSKALLLTKVDFPFSNTYPKSLTSGEWMLGYWQRQADTGYTWKFHLFTRKVIINLVKDLVGKGHLLRQFLHKSSTMQKHCLMKDLDVVELCA